MDPIAAEVVEALLPLTSERLIYRRLTPADAADVRGYASRIEVSRYTSTIPHPYPPGAAETWIEATRRPLKESGTLEVALARRADDRALGAFLLRFDTDGGGEIGYVLDSTVWNRGLMSEAVARLVDAAFDDFGLGYLSARVHHENAASQKVLLKNGFRQTGEEVMTYPARGWTARTLWFRLDRTDCSRRPTVVRAALPTVLVGAAALIDVDGRVLLARRPPGKAMAGLWEFPGGKVGPGETPEAAVTRELREELGIDVSESCLAAIAFASHRYDRFHLLMPLFACRRWKGEVAAREGQELSWVRPQRLGDYAMPPADRPLIAQLRDLL
jgi:8-oxo-dGTP diphosphatase